MQYTTRVCEGLGEAGGEKELPGLTFVDQCVSDVVYAYHE
jgi:hypothetical protein